MGMSEETRSIGCDVQAKSTQQHSKGKLAEGFSMPSTSPS